LLGSIIAITGPSGSGKSWLARNLTACLAEMDQSLATEILPEDAYYRNQDHLEFSERTRVNYDHPRALEHELLLEQLNCLRAGEPVNVPVYDYVNHTRARRTRPLQPPQLLIVEGVLVLSDPRLRKQFDLTLYLDTPIELCLDRRIQRDVRERGRTKESVKQQFADSVLPMYQEYVLPGREHADLLIDGQTLQESRLQALAERLLSQLQGPD
jgi:uridine kinase